MNLRLAATLLLSFALHGWLLWATPAPAIQAPSGKVALSLGQLRLSSAAAPESAAALENATDQAAPQSEPLQPKISEKPQPVKTIEQTVVAKREPAKAERAERMVEEKTEETSTAAAAPTATAPQIGVGDEPVLVDRPAFASPPSPPTYPRLARQRRQQGTVVIEVQLGRSGEQVARQLLRSSGVDSLDEAALAAVKSWRFLPYREDGRPRQSRVQLPIRFTL